MKETNNMEKNYYKIIISFILIIFFLTGCTQTGKKVKGFKHDTPLIKTDVKKLGKAELEKDAIINENSPKNNDTNCIQPK